MIQFDSKTGAPLREISTHVARPLVTDKPLPSEGIGDNQYYSFRDENDAVPYWPTNQCNWVVKNKQVSITAYHKDTRELKEFDDISLVTNDYTLDKPVTIFDYWTESGWKTDEQAKFEYDYKQVNDRRYQLYTIMVDRLRNEAVSIESVEGDSLKAAEYRAQADAAYLKIKEDNPFPEPPEL
ncbi:MULTISPECIES: hypothetical protein [unclassified Vibrio]|uniref:hypothetical protein n=1 Tax=unclassified Vibrio TaxID=2614977 RepID=UPI0013614CDF|nr:MULTISPECIES: hypothetical protein [unclassified Vibrio]NAW56989.1 hypothetical protein [Vibrio sp. V36_P2S2PM302]NAX27641.1 hypothetical protein [Vibrio sp. V38_P2S17PM301]NAX29389.1 hypothetical protein [Vibrio sp. V37_P2S8PM304]